MGIESTQDASQRPANGFEDRGPDIHRRPSTSAAVRSRALQIPGSPALVHRRPPRWLSSWLSAIASREDSFFPSLISGPFQHGLVLVLSFSIASSLVAAAASALRGGHFAHQEAEPMPLREAPVGLAKKGGRLIAAPRAPAFSGVETVLFKVDKTSRPA